LENGAREAGQVLPKVAEKESILVYDAVASRSGLQIAYGIYHISYMSGWWFGTFYFSMYWE